MKFKYIKSLVMMFIASQIAVISSCNYLDVSGYFDDTLKYDSVFTSRIYLEKYLWGMANELPDPTAIFGNDVTPGETATDEIFTLNHYNLFHGKALTLGLVSSSNLQGMNSWTPAYKTIRKCNEIISRIGECRDLTPIQRSEFIGYCHFFRAYAYTLILMNYGPAVIVGDEVMSNNESSEYYSRARATYDETVDYICDEFEEAAKFIPADVDIANYGRPTQGVAYAMIARVRLHAASPSFNGGPSATRYFSTWTRSTDGAQYVSQTYDERKWALAAAACKRVIDMNRYKLHTVEKVLAENATAGDATPTLPDNVSDAPFPAGAGDIDPLRSYSNMFNGTTYPVQNREFIWGTYSGSITEFTRQSFPLFMGGYNSMCIPQKVIDAYRMRDGKSIEEATDGKYAYSETGNCRMQENFSGYRVLRGTFNMYVNREMRFYACVGYSGAFWPATSCNNNNFRNQTISYINGANAGMDKSFQNPLDYCVTGYVVKKYIHPEDNWYNGDGSTRIQKTFPIIRYAEILLSYAEAVNHLSNTHTVELPSGHNYTLSRGANMQEAVDGFNMVRYRSGLPGLEPEEYTSEEIFEPIIRRERFIEFFAEGRRYYDLRRWGTLEEEESFPIEGMNVETNKSTEFFARTVVNHADYRNRVCDRKMVFLPIDYNEIKKSPLVDQNPGW